MVVANHVDRALGHATSSLAISRIKDKLTKTSQSNVAVSVQCSRLVKRQSCLFLFSRELHERQKTIEIPAHTDLNKFCLDPFNQKRNLCLLEQCL